MIDPLSALFPSALALKKLEWPALIKKELAEAGIEPRTSPDKT